MDAVLYVHGKGGSAAESEHYKPLFPACEVTGLDYQTFTPGETGKEIRAAVETLRDSHENIVLIAATGALADTIEATSSVPLIPMR